jgi:GntR family transcriptional regulator
VFDDELIRHGITVESVLIRGAVEPLPSWAGQALQLGADAKGVTLERLRLVDGHVALYVVNHLPPDYVVILPEMERNSSASLYRTLCEHCGAKVAGSSRTLEAVSAPAVLAHRLGVPVRYPLVYVQSVSRNAMGHPIDCYRAWLRTDTIRIAIETDTWASLTGRVVNHSFLDVLNENNVRTI